MALEIESTPINPAQAANNQYKLGMPPMLDDQGAGSADYEILAQRATTIIKEYNEAQKTRGGDREYHALRLLNGSNGLLYSAVIVAEAFNCPTTNKRIVSAHLLMVESTGSTPAIKTLYMQDNREAYTVIRTPADALDATYMDRAIATICANLGLRVQDNNCVIVEGTLIPTEFDFKTGLVDSLIKNAINAVNTENNIIGNYYEGICITEIMQTYPRGSNFSISVSYGGEDANSVNLVGIPTRRDVCITTSFKHGGRNTNSMSVNRGDDVTELVRVYGYVDFVWIDKPQAQPNMLPLPGQCFTPNFIITEIVTPSVTPTPDFILLGILSVRAFMESNRWKELFVPQITRKGELNLTDLAVLNIEGNIENNPLGFGQPYNTKDKNYGLVEAMNILTTYMRKDTYIISIDVPKADPTSWYIGLLSDMRQDRASAKASTERLNYFAAKLTNGRFPQFFTNWFDVTQSKIMNGYYKTTRGYKDIRYLNNYLAVGNYLVSTSGSPELLRAYSSTLYSTTQVVDWCTWNREKRIEEMCGSTAKYKTWSHRLTFTCEAILTLGAAAKEAGYSPNIGEMVRDGAAINDRYNYNVNNTLINAVGANRMFPTGIPTMGGNVWQPFSNNYSYYGGFFTPPIVVPTPPMQ